MNLGGVAIDAYTSTNAGTIPSCPYSYTIRQCYTLMFNNNPGVSPYSSSNYVAQGVTGVRFQFELTGGGQSTPFNSSGTMQGAWETNLILFLQDLHSYGIVRVTPQPNMSGWPGDVYYTGAGASCSGTGLLYFPWLP